MKVIHLTDTHVAPGTLYGGDPTQALRHAVASINAEHSDAECVIVTGDLTHWGDAESYVAFAEAIGALTMPVHLMMGNHDDSTAFRAHFPAAPRDANGFVQCRLQTPLGDFILMDTREDGTHAGAYCAQRRAWLQEQLEASDAPVFLFMHHPPFTVGIKGMDAIMLQDAEAFHEVLASHKQRIRHLFFGHLHRALFGNWRGISYSCMRGLNHQVALDLRPNADHVNGTFEAPAYGVVLISDETVVVHMHDFTYDGAAFAL